MQCIWLKFLPNLCNKFSLVAMTTSLENLLNKFDIICHEGTTIAAKNESMVHMIGVMANFVQFWLWNPKLSCHGNLPCKFQQRIWNRRSLCHQKMQKYWICGAYDWNNDHFYIINQNLVAMATPLKIWVRYFKSVARILNYSSSTLKVGCI